MKRSEAEKRINDWLDQSDVITGKTILGFAEELGMLPPKCYSGYVHIPELGGDINKYEYKWEEDI